VRVIPADLESDPPAGKTGDGASRNGTAAAIHDAALRLFAERGYESTTMKAIAERVGIGASAIYNHVDSKQDLLRAIVKGTIQQLIDDAHAAIASTEDVEDQLRCAVCAHVKFHAEHRFEMVISERDITNLEEPARTGQIAYREEYIGIFERLIERGIALGRFDTRSPKLATYAILQMGMGVSIWYRRSGEMTPSDVGTLYAEYAARIVRGESRLG
jgi:AcrR family transcriptional regulator